MNLRESLEVLERKKEKNVKKFNVINFLKLM